MPVLREVLLRYMQSQNTHPVAPHCTPARSRPRANMSNVRQVLFKQGQPQSTHPEAPRVIIDLGLVPVDDQRYLHRQRDTSLLVRIGVPTLRAKNGAVPIPASDKFTASRKQGKRR
jgi:hypothetical protein